LIVQAKNRASSIDLSIIISSTVSNNPIEMSQVIAESSNSSHSLTTQSTLVDTEKYYCPFLERGFCRDLSRCKFSHDCHTSTKIPPDYCHFYLANHCLFGQECKFLHCEPDNDNTLLSNIVNTSSTQSDSLFFANGNDNSSSSNNFLNDDGDDPPEQNHDVYSNQNQPDAGDLDHDTEVAGQYVCHGDEQSREPDGEDPVYNNNINDPNHSLDNSNQWYNLTDENNQPSSSSSRLRAIRISHRCAMTTPSTSTTIIATLKLPANLTAQNPSKNSTSSTSESKTATAAATAGNKSSWQGARLIASIRNNLGLNDQASSSSGNVNNSANNDEDNGLKDLPMCPYAMASGECPYPVGQCNYLHGLICDLCYSSCLHPYNEEQRHQHREECLREHEREMELSFAVQRSKDKVCGICMDTVVEKKPVTSSRFGILEKCNHIFCLDCIRKWRGTKQFDSRTIRACPECRVSSDFVIPSKYWVEDQDDKEKLINDYKAALK
jgi:hypothetical protein